VYKFLLFSKIIYEYTKSVCVKNASVRISMAKKQKTRLII